MTKIKFIGYYNKDGLVPKDSGGTGYGNYLNYPFQQLVSMLRNEYQYELVEDESFDTLVITDLDEDLYRYAKTNSGKKIILQLCESVIYTPFAHSLHILSDSIWSSVVSYNREIETPNTIFYDIPITGIQMPLSLSKTKRKDKICVISSFKNDDAGYCYDRDLLIKHLADKKMCDVYGTNWRLKKNYQGRSENKVSTISEYQYYFACENSRYSGYVTEKLGDAILAETPCLYYGDFENAQRRFPDTFVPLNDLTLESVKKAMKILDDNYDFYKENVLKSKENSIHWCDSYIETMLKAILS